ncbi:Glutamate--tRNA ligase mitochondrial [Coemansia sp. Benny D115]|nr:Glutamate--tRNA ligase mitochondrial [Coemansia sp. Benny D115]
MLRITTRLPQLQRSVSVSSTRLARVHSCSHSHDDPASTPTSSLSTPARVRFAPSPTGMLHLGGLRTALFNHLLARRTNGSFILRIEDTDQRRLVPHATENIISALAWAGISFDEGPVFQSDRTEIYRKHAEQLLRSGHAYRCFCTPERLEHLRLEASAQGRPPMYDRRCTHLSQSQVDEKIRTGEPSVVRLRMPQPGGAVCEFNDIVHGHMRFRGPAGFDDAVLLKSDGQATYHLANVVDDHLMRITHVLRGEEWLISTPKHQALFNAFGWHPPQYAHLPLLMNPDGSKLSKRNSDSPVQTYVDAGYLPEAMVNYAALLGWHPQGGTQEVFSMKQLEDSFSLKGLGRSKSAVSRERLDWLNRQHLRIQIASNDASKLAKQAADEINKTLNEKNIADGGLPSTTSVDPETALLALRLCSDRLTFTGDLYDAAPFLFSAPNLAAPEAVTMLNKVPRELQASLLNNAISQVASLGDCKEGGRVCAEKWTGFAKSVAASTENALPKHAMLILRYALTGKPTGPKLPDLLGFFTLPDITQRLQSALTQLGN